MKIFIILLIFIGYSTYTSAQKTWIGAGAGGAGTDFNTSSNWSPSGVPTTSDNVSITLTSSATINVSANVTLNNLTFSVNGNNVVGLLNVGASVLTINGTTTIDLPGAANNSTRIIIGVNGGTSAGIINFLGNVSIGATDQGGSRGGAPGALFIGNTNSTLLFRGNLTMGIQSGVATGTSRPGTFVFDAAGTQTITWNNTRFYANFDNVIIGQTNNPTVNQITGAITPDDIINNLTVNGSSILNLGTSIWNHGAGGGVAGIGGTLTMNGTSQLQLGAASGGQTGSNFPLNFSTYTLSNTSTVIYNSTSAQTIFDITSPGYGNLTVSNNSIKTAGGNGLDIKGNVIINTTATFAASTFTHNIGGNFTNNGTFTQGSSNVVFNGSSTQIISGSTSTTFNNITFNNTSGITLSQAASVNGTATFTGGVVATTTTNLLTMNAGSAVSGGSSTSHVNGPVAKAGTTAFTFPTGNGTFYRTIAIGTPSASSTFRAQFFRANPVSSISPYSLGSGLTRISVCEYWMLDRTAGTGNASVTLSWGTNTGCGATNYVNDIPNLRVARHNGGLWVNEGNSATTGTNAAGTVTSNTVTSFSPFTLAAGGTLNPLPVNFVDVNGRIQSNNAVIEWTNATESDLDAYVVERSFDGRRFETAGMVLPKANNGSTQNYSFVEVQAASIGYYRIRAVENNGSNKTSSIIKLNKNNSSTRGIAIYPNPVIKKTVVLQSSNLDAGKYAIRLLNVSGAVVFLKELQLPVGSFVQTIQLPEMIAPGVYLLMIENGSFKKSIKLMVK